MEHVQELEDSATLGSAEKQFIEACKNGQEAIVRQLLEDKKANPNIKNGLQKQTALHIATMDDKVDIVKLLLEKGANPNIQDKNGCIPIHYAAADGNVATVKLLMDKSDCTILGGKPKKKTPMMCACVNGHAKVVELLLKLGSESPVVYKDEATADDTQEDIVSIDDEDSICTDDTQNIACTSVLVEAINRGYEDVAMTIVSSLQVKEALEFKVTLKNEETTPLRMLFEKMPAVAEKAINVKCIDVPKPETIARDSENFEVTFHYQYLDDFADYYPPEDRFKWMPKHFNRKNHSLHILANSDSKKLLKHPAVTTLLYYKWTSFAQYLFFFNLVLHILFAFLLTTFALTVRKPESDTCIVARENKSAETCDIVSFDGQPHVVIIFGTLIILFAIIRLGYEIFQIAKLRLHYLQDWVNYVELPLFSGSILFVFVFATNCLCPESWQWQIGAFCLFLAWIDLIAFVRMVPIIGIYVVMFVVIVWNFVKVATLAIFLILSFSFSFHMLFYDPRETLRTPFQNAGKSFVKTLTMTTGELDFNDIFFSNDGPGLLYAGISYPLWILFIVMMPILLNNLLTGLAVDDVQEILENAEIESLALWVEFVLLFEQLLPKSWLIKIWRKRKTNDETKLEEYTEEKINPDKYPETCLKFFWHRALNLSHFDTYGTKLIAPDPTKESEKIEKNFEKLATRTEEIEQKFELRMEQFSKRIEGTLQEELDKSKSSIKELIEHQNEAISELKSMNSQLISMMKDALPGSKDFSTDD